MLVACRLTGLSALEAHYADNNAQAQSGVEAQHKPRHPRAQAGPPPFLVEVSRHPPVTRGRHLSRTRCPSFHRNPLAA
jgi:hypothetical protein